MSARTATVEIRPDDKGGIDEIVADGVSIHVERMNGSDWFMGFEGPNGEFWQFWFGAKNGRSVVEFRHTEHEPARAKS